MTAALRQDSRDTDTSTPRPALRVVVRAAPRREPPFEDEVAPSPILRGYDGYDQVLPFERPRGRRDRWPLDVRRGSLPDPAVWGRRLLVGLIETADGRRPLAQLAPLLSMSVGRGVGLDLERAAGSGRAHWLHRASVRTVRATEPSDGVAELCATLDTGTRVRAVALRVEAHNDRWRCTRLQMG